MVGHWLVRALLTLDSYINVYITGLEAVWTIAFAIYFLSSIWLSSQSWADRRASRSPNMQTRRAAALTRSTANHFVVVSNATVVISIMGLFVGIASMLSPQNLNATEQQRVLGALMRLTFVVIAIALTTSNLTLVHWRSVAPGRVAQKLQRDRARAVR